MTDTEMVVLSLRLPEGLHARAAERAHSEDGSLNAWIRGVIAEGLSERGSDRGARGKPGRSSVALADRPATAGDSNDAGMAASSRPSQPASDPGSRSESSFRAPAGPRGFKRAGPDPKVKKY